MGLEIKILFLSLSGKNSNPKEKKYPQESKIFKFVCFQPEAHMLFQVYGFSCSQVNETLTLLVL